MQRGFMMAAYVTVFTATCTLCCAFSHTCVFITRCSPHDPVRQAKMFWTHFTARGSQTFPDIPSLQRPLQPSDAVYMRMPYWCLKESASLAGTHCGTVALESSSCPPGAYCFPSSFPLTGAEETQSANPTTESPKEPGFYPRNERWFIIWFILLAELKSAYCI